MIRTAKNLLGVAILLSIPLVMAAIGLALMLALSVMIGGV